MKKYLLTFLFIVNLFANNQSEQRIITLSPSLNEIVFALGSGKNIVANTKYCNYPEESRNIPKVGGYASISLEKMLKAKPTLVLAQNYDEQLLLNLKKLNLNYHSFKTDNLKSIKTTIKSVATLLGKEEKAKELILDIDKKLNEVSNIVKNKDILIVISPREDLQKSIYVTGNNLYFNDIIKASGNKNAYKSKSLAQPVVNVEKIIHMNPDIIILLAPYIHDNKISFKQLKKPWKKLPVKASKNDNIYIIDKEYAGIPSHRVVYFMEDFKDILVNVRDK
ncbi:iron ABC transporter substrate-binding protein [Arcobacter sp. CECT 8983]|uniref:ABC transporter substrate-binding protein n=1 Tax=Arcobacter sp. CECT 8983 TaxID=2044508 RepID=UPI00100AC7FE|nr:ABC transporter substrate-binding protein [Arcobacter sp. CECT 8983]RXJ89155.1 iron ABC transporter substrate-binding protein [Arcobacter sp. CECT 8983]